SGSTSLLQPPSASGEKKYLELRDQATRTASLIREKARDDIVLLATHFDADGVSAGSIMLTALNRLPALTHLRVIDRIDENILEAIEQIQSGLVIFTDIGTGYLDNIPKMKKTLDIVIDDHHHHL